MLGPMLVGNPWLTIKIIRAAAEVKGIAIDAEDPACELELRSMTLKKQFIEEKKDHQIQK